MKVSGRLTNVNDRTTPTITLLLLLYGCTTNALHKTCASLTGYITINNRTDEERTTIFVMAQILYDHRTRHQPYGKIFGLISVANTPTLDIDAPVWLRWSRLLPGRAFHFALTERPPRFCSLPACSHSCQPTQSLIHAAHKIAHHLIANCKRLLH
jgi:hypothetical protein